MLKKRNLAAGGATSQPTVLCFMSKEVRVMITHDSVEKVALKLYMKSGNTEGHDLDNWLEAERIVWNSIEEETQYVLELQT